MIYLLFLVGMAGGWWKLQGAVPLFYTVPLLVFLSLNFSFLLRKQEAFVSQVLNRGFDI